MKIPNSRDFIGYWGVQKRLWVAVAALGVGGLVISRPLWRGQTNKGPTLDRGSLWFGTVQRGDWSRTIETTGTLVASQVRWLTTMSPGRVDAVLAKPGSMVNPKTIVVKLSNPELRLTALDAERQLRSAEAALIGLKVTLDSQTLAQEANVTAQQGQLGALERQARTYRDLGKEGLAPALEVDEVHHRANDLASRLVFEERRLAMLSAGAGAQIEARKAEVTQLRDIAELRRREVSELTLRAGESGVLNEVAIEPGQWLTAGALVAKVANPTALAVDIRLTKEQVALVQKGLDATIYTPTGQLTAKVTEIEILTGDAGARARLAIETQPPDLKAETPVRVTIKVQHREHVLVMRQPATGQREGILQLYRVAGSKAVRVPVELGGGNEEVVEIKSGLDDGDQVILSNMSMWSGAPSITLQ